MKKWLYRLYIVLLVVMIVVPFTIKANKYRLGIKSFLTPRAGEEIVIPKENREFHRFFKEQNISNYRVSKVFNEWVGRMSFMASVYPTFIKQDSKYLVYLSSEDLETGCERIYKGEKSVSVARCD